MKLGFVSAILDGWTFEEMIDTAANMGFSCVEVACWPVGKAERRYAGVSHINVDELTDEKAAHILDACGDELPIWSGNDDLTVPLLSLGAKGVISVLSNVRPKRTLQMVRACQAGDYAAAGRMQVALTPLIDALFSEINPIPVKQALSLMGIPAGLPRLPLTPLSATHLPALEQALSAAPEP